MEKIILEIPTLHHETQSMECCKEFEDEGVMLNGGTGLDTAESYRGWLDYLVLLENMETVPEGYMSSSSYFGIRESDGRIVGIINLRHELNDFLRGFGGHIGYSVRASERRKGYASEMLRLCLEKARELGIERVLLTCNANNVGSYKTIESQGGVLERECDTDKGRLRYYWITI